MFHGTSPRFQGCVQPARAVKIVKSTQVMRQAWPTFPIAGRCSFLLRNLGHRMKLDLRQPKPRTTTVQKAEHRQQAIGLCRKAHDLAAPRPFPGGRNDSIRFGVGFEHGRCSLSAGSSAVLRGRDASRVGTTGGAHHRRRGLPIVGAEHADLRLFPTRHVSSFTKRIEPQQGFERHALVVRAPHRKSSLLRIGADVKRSRAKAKAVGAHVRLSSKEVPSPRPTHRPSFGPPNAMTLPSGDNANPSKAPVPVNSLRNVTPASLLAHSTVPSGSATRGRRYRDRGGALQR